MSKSLPLSAITEGDVERLEELLSNGDIDMQECCYFSKGHGACSALMLASAKGRVAVVRLLL